MFLAVTCKLNFLFSGKLFRVCRVYAPNHNPTQDQFLKDLHPKIDPSILTVLCGDFNEVSDCSRDWVGSGLSVSSLDSSSSPKYLFKDCCMIDKWRHLHPSSMGFTWTRWVQVRPIVLTFSVFHFHGCIVPCPFSDHCGVCLNDRWCYSSWSRFLEA